MKRLLTITTLLIIGIGISLPVHAQIRELAIGSTAPMLDQELQDVSGRTVTLNSVARSNGLLVIFSCNTCPWVNRWEDRYPMVSSIARANNVGMIALNPNEDYRGRGDSMEDMIKRASKSGYDFPYALDQDHRIADAFGASRTPHVYLFNGDMELVYVGAIDDNANSAADVKQFYIRDAIEQMASGQEVTVTNTRSLGCTIKRVR